MSKLEWQAVTKTMIESKCKTYQISQGQHDNKRKHIYRAYHRPTNTVLAEIDCWDEQQDRAAATLECKKACQHDNALRPEGLPFPASTSRGNTGHVVAKPSAT